VKTGYNIIILGRSQQKLNALIKSLNEANSAVEVKGIQCDFSSFASTLKACNEVREKDQTLNLIILNAGLWNFEQRNSQDGIEETLHVNLISQIEVFKELIHLVPKDGESKIIMTSSGLHQGEINFEDLEFKQKFSGFQAYRQSKLGLLLITRWLAEQADHKGVSFYSIHPGMVRTQLGRDAGWLSRTIFKLLGKSAQKGAQTHIHLIDADNSSLANGEYYASKKVTKTTPYSYDMKVAERLWKEVSRYLELK
jgi:NAD(P)-dependent dehydrogenase (short-subunit alcohol dehydrogenase family)